MKVPAKIGQKSVMIEYSVIDAEIPLLLSKTAMKRAKTRIDFQNDVVEMFGHKQKNIIYQEWSFHNSIK